MEIVIRKYLIKTQAIEMQEVMSEKEENSVIVSNLPFSIKEPDILAFCGQAGEVLKVHLTTHSNSNRSKGWA